MVVGLGEIKLWLVKLMSRLLTSGIGVLNVERNDIMDKCFYCKGIMEDGITNYMADLNGHFVIIRNVP